MVRKNTKKNENNAQIAKEITKLKSLYSQIKSTTNIKNFADIPLSAKTLKGLESAGYSTVTEIQRESIIPALKSNDILAAAKTGSGKTLAFLIPILEHLYVRQVSPYDGTVALVITPTRELALQIYRVLEKICSEHIFSIGLLIGGDVREEGVVGRINIVVATPGRLLQQMEETAHFVSDSVGVVVLDEADRILDLGFSASLNAIINNLPTNRQTLLFSATQTKSVKDLARLSLKDPLYISVHEFSRYSTPNELKQNYMVCPIGDKITLLWSFIRKHPKSKILVFFSTCKQVKFFHDLFRSLRLGSPLLCLHGMMKQPQRIKIFNEYDTKNCTLFATDLAARGLDFPGVHWVVQYDCPDSVESYIHRVGRTARYGKTGHSLLILLPAEEETGFISRLCEERIPIEETKVNAKLLDEHFEGKVQSCCAQSSLIKEMAKKAVLAYVKSVFFATDKKLFDVAKLDLKDFSLSMGLTVTPRVRFLAKTNLNATNVALKIKTDDLLKVKTDLDSDIPLEKDKAVEVKSKKRECGERSEDVYNLADAKRRMEEADIADIVRQVNKNNQKKKKVKKHIDNYLAEKPLSEIESMASKLL